MHGDQQSASLTESQLERINSSGDDSDDTGTADEPIPTSSFEPTAAPNTIADVTPQDRPDAQSQAVASEASSLEGKTTTIEELGDALKQDKIEAAVKFESPEYDFDDMIIENDPYFKLGCVRRMVFTSDPVPVHKRYKTIPRENSTTTDVEYPSAVEKLLKWFRKRETIPRHFVLKMGPPNGMHGRPETLGDKLKAT